MKDKKGQLDLVLYGVITIAMAGFLLIMSLIMLDSMMIGNNDLSLTVTNETVTPAHEAGVRIVNSGRCGFSAFTVIALSNSTTSAVINLNNYSWGDRDGILKYKSPASELWNTSQKMNVSYSYSYSNDSACLSANSTIFGMGRFADYIDLIALAIIITVILSLVMVIISRRTTQ